MSLHLFVVLLICALNNATPLLPEAEKFTHAKAIDEKQMDQNAYVYLMAIDAEDDDYFEVGKKIVLQTNKVVREALKEESQVIMDNDIKNPLYNYKKQDVDFIIKGKPYNYPCVDLNNVNCVDDVLKVSKFINVLLDKNKKLLARYEEVRQQPNYDSYSQMMAYTPLPNFRILMRLSALRQMQAIMAISLGDTERGLDILQQEISFSKHILSGNGELIDKMVAFRLLLTQYHTLGVLLDHLVIQNNATATQLTTLLRPLTIKEQQAVANALESELRSQAYLYKTIDTGDVFIFYDKNLTINNHFLKIQPFIQKASIPLPDASGTYRSLLNTKVPKPKPDPRVVYQTINEILEPDYERNKDSFFSIKNFSLIIKAFQKHGLNIIGGALLDVGMPDYENYIFRLYDVQSYLSLVNVKFLIKQQHITKEQLPKFLKDLGDNARNPYTKQPFVWDKKTSTLSTEEISTDVIIDGNNDHGRLAVKLLFD